MERRDVSKMRGDGSTKSRDGIRVMRSTSRLLFKYNVEQIKLFEVFSNCSNK